MCGLHSELYSGVIHRQKGCTESEITVTCGARVHHLWHDIVGLLAKALHHPVSHNWSGSILKSAAMTNGVRIDCINSKICAILT